MTALASPDIVLKQAAGASSETEQRPSAPTSATRQAKPADAAPDLFTPVECESFKQLGLPDALIESLVFKHLLAVGTKTCRGMARELAVPPKDLLAMLTDLKNRQYVVYKGSASMGDFEYTLTESGRERAKKYLDECTYAGTAPVLLKDYVNAIRAQTITSEQPSADNLREAFADLLLSPHMLDRLGPAINSGRGMFLYGYPGNGKTSIAERITRCFGTTIWIPRTMFIDGEIVQLYDPQVHEAVGDGKASVLKGPQPDARWVQIKRPTIVVGGELTMDALEMQFNPTTRITEPPIQLKSNCGTLVIDDFGRQRMNPTELLNRWIVPLEKRYDYLTLANGKKIQVPFDQLIIFSTNLEPKQLVDDAFLRRIPYKINIVDPTEEEYRRIMQIVAKKVNIEFDDSAYQHLLATQYHATKRALRCCHPRDLLLQILNGASYRREEPRMTPETLDAACENYFPLI